MKNGWTCMPLTTKPGTGAWSVTSAWRSVPRTEVETFAVRVAHGTGEQIAKKFPHWAQAANKVKVRKRDQHPTNFPEATSPLLPTNSLPCVIRYTIEVIILTT